MNIHFDCSKSKDLLFASHGIHNQEHDAMTGFVQMHDDTIYERLLHFLSRMTTREGGQSVLSKLCEIGDIAYKKADSLAIKSNDGEMISYDLVLGDVPDLRFRATQPDGTDGKSIMFVDLKEADEWAEVCKASDDEVYCPHHGGLAEKLRALLKRFGVSFFETVLFLGIFHPSEAEAIMHVFRDNILQDASESFRIERARERDEKEAAIVGAGPAGLVASIKLVQEGWKVTAFEKRELFERQNNILIGQDEKNFLLSLKFKGRLMKNIVSG